MTDPASAQTIVFFDGVCHLCNSFVDFLVARDPQGRLRFAPLQGKTAAKLLQPYERENLDTVLVWHQGKLLSRSDAVLQALSQIGGFWTPLTVVMKWVPRFVRNQVYDFVARNRYNWFGQRETCRLPTSEENSRLLE